MKKARRSKSSAAAVVARVNAQLGVTAVGLASDPRFTVSKIPTGSLVIDRITGGGFPRGRHVELFGPEMAGKSTIAMMTLALAQQRGEVVGWIDGERVFDADWFEWLGGDPNGVVIMRARTAEKVIKTLQLFAQEDDDNPGLDVVAIDSVASLLPQEELKKDVEEGDDRTASRARMMSRLLRRVTAVNDKTLFLWINQVIDNVGGYGGTTTPGGRALRHYASVRVELKTLDRVKKPRKRVKKGKMTDSDSVVGHWVAVRAAKQKTATPELSSMLYFDYERKMIDPEYEIIHLGLEDGLISASGKPVRYTYEDSDGNTWTGTESVFRRHLREQEEMREELEWAISEQSRAIGTDNEEDGDDSSD